MSIIGKQLPEFTLDAFKKPELVKVSTADVLGKWSIFVFYPADFTFVCPTEIRRRTKLLCRVERIGLQKFTPYLVTPNSFTKHGLMLLKH